MNLESYLIIACLAGNPQSCSKSGEAYYVYSGYNRQIEDYAKRIEKDHKDLLFVVAISSSIAEKKLVIPLSRTKIITYQADPSLNNLSFVWNF